MTVPMCRRRGCQPQFNLEETRQEGEAGNTRSDEQQNGRRQRSAQHSDCKIESIGECVAQDPISNMWLSGLLSRGRHLVPAC